MSGSNTRARRDDAREGHWTGPAWVYPDKATRLENWVTEHVDWVHEALVAHGALMFRGFGIDSAESFERVVQGLCPTPLDYVYGSTPRTAVGNGVYTASEYRADAWIPLHNENSYQRDWPMRLVFACLRPADEGGETPLARTKDVGDRIAAATVRAFAERGVMYVRNYGHGIDLPWEAAFETDSRSKVESYCREHGIEWQWLADNRLRTRQVCRATASHPVTGEELWFNQAHLFHISSLGGDDEQALLEIFAEPDLPRNAYHGDGSPIDRRMLDDIRRAYEAATVSFPWEKGDVLVLDNMLVAHSRRPFTGPRKVLVAMGDPFSSYTNGQPNGLPRPSPKPQPL